MNKPGWAPVKLPQTGEFSSRRAYFIYCRSSYGPTFGGGFDIYISNYASSNSNSYSDLGWTYSPPSGYRYSSTFARTFLAGSYKFTPDEVETFYETNEKQQCTFDIDSVSRQFTMCSRFYKTRKRDATLKNVLVYS